MSEATPARCRAARRYVANARLALAAAHGDSSKGPLHRPEGTGLGARPMRGRGAQALGLSLTRSRQIRCDPNDDKDLQLQTLVFSLIAPHSVSREVTNRAYGADSREGVSGFTSQT